MFQLSDLLLVIIMFACALLVSLRYFLIPMWKKQKIVRAHAYCPSILVPEFPEAFNQTIEVPSQKKEDTIYRVNLFSLTCTCRRFKTHRGFYPGNDIRRLCRHIRKEFETSPLITGIDDMHMCIIKKRVRDKCYEVSEIHNTPVAFGFHPRSDFVRIYSRTKAPYDSDDGPLTGYYDKFTLNLSQEVWIYGTPPPGSEEVIAKAKELLVKYLALNKVKNWKHKSLDRLLFSLSR